jgi:guanidinopropionase
LKTNMSDHYDRTSPVTGESGNPMNEPRFLELATFMRAPLAKNLSDLDVALVGVPYDGAVTNRPGTRHGPREIRNQSTNVRRIHPLTRTDPFENFKVADVGDVIFDSLYDIEAVHQKIEDFITRLIESRVVPLTAGGDHSISYPILRAVARDRPVGLIQIDAHTDTWDSWKGSSVHHGAPFRRAVEDGLIDPQRTIQIGIRGPQNVTDGWDYSEQTGMRLLFMHEVAEMGIEAVISEARRVVGDGPTYLTFDIDGIDPAFAPGTGTPEIGGFTTLEVQRILWGLHGVDFVGADVVEVSPPFDSSGITALAGASVMYELLNLLTEAIQIRRRKLQP